VYSPGANRADVAAPAGARAPHLTGDSRSNPGPDEAAPPESANYHEAVLRFKRELLRASLDRMSGNQTRAAEMLGLQRTYLSRLLRELGVRTP